MSLKIDYCEICGVRLTPESFHMGDAVELDGAPYCRECARKLQGRQPGETLMLRAAGSKTPRPGAESSGRMRALSPGGLTPRGKRKVRVKCPRCNTMITADLPAGGGKIVCGVCGTTLVVRKKREKDKAPRRRRRRRR